MRDGHFAEACAKFAESETLDPGVGTMLNLAYCYEKVGKKARAWSEYESAAVAAHRAGKSDWESAARARAALLAGKVGWVVVNLEKLGGAIDIEIRIDGEPLAISAADRPTPTDLGHHEVSVRATGKQSWSTTFEVDEQHVPTVEVPPLAPMPATTMAASAVVVRGTAQTPAAEAPARHGSTSPAADRVAGHHGRLLGAVALGVVPDSPRRRARRTTAPLAPAPSARRKAGPLRTRLSSRPQLPLWPSRRASAPARGRESCGGAPKVEPPGMHKAEFDCRRDGVGSFVVGGVVNHYSPETSRRRGSLPGARSPRGSCSPAGAATSSASSDPTSSRSAFTTRTAPRVSNAWRAPSARTLAC